MAPPDGEVTKRDDALGQLNEHPHRERRRWPREAQSQHEATPPGPPALEPLVFSTRELEPTQQFAAWQAHVAPLVDVRLPDNKSGDDGFPADHVAWNLGRMLIVQQTVPAHSYARSAAKLRSSSIDHWFIVLPRSGRAWTEVDGRVVESHPGGVEIRSLGYPFRGRATDSQSLCLYLPRDLFTDTAAPFDARNNSVLSDNFANLLLGYVNGIEARLRNLAAEDLPRVVQATRDMIIAGLSSPAEHDAAFEHLTGVALMERARRYIQSHLEAPDLTPETLCRALGVSRSRLYQLFEPSGGVVHYIQRRRLLAAHAALSDPVDIRRIIDIAEAVGFSSSANFSRAFSKEFGYSPREARNAEAWLRPAHPNSLADHEKAGSFEDWLKALGS
jgi:AraC-like DNA-binding protein